MRSNDLQQIKGNFKGTVRSDFTLEIQSKYLLQGAVLQILRLL